MKISERDFSSQVEDLLNLGRWHWFHPRPARVWRDKETYETPYSGYKGFLDYIALRPPRILVFELKSENGKMTPEQEEWFELWRKCQRIITSEPVKMARGKMVETNTASSSFSMITIPEVYLWTPDQFEEVKEILT